MIWDEYAHGFISGSISRLQYNPGYRENYYQTILADWSQVYNADNFMGGAIWNLVDYYNEGLNQTNGGIGTWGQLDIWGREKPESYATKNVYSPVQYQGSNAVDLRKTISPRCRRRLIRARSWPMIRMRRRLMSMPRSSPFRRPRSICSSSSPLRNPARLTRAPFSA